jgi:hypothetical protein
MARMAFGSVADECSPGFGAAVLLLSFCLLVFVDAGSAKDARTPPGERRPLIRSVGYWPLSEIGVEKREISARSPSSSAIVARYRLPADAVQGRDMWYLIRLKFRLVVASRSGEGRIYVSAATGRPSDVRTSAQLRFDVARRNEQVHVTSDSLGLVSGHRVEKSSARVRNVDFVNYIPYAGVRPGENVMTVRLEHYGRAAVDRLVLDERTGIELSRFPPQRLSIEARPQHAEVVRGESVTIHVGIRNDGRPSQEGQLEVVHPERVLDVTGPNPVRLSVVRPGAKRQQRIVLRAREPGTHSVTVRARSALEQPTAVVRIVVTDESPTARPAVIGLVLGAACVAAVPAVVFYRRRRSHR